MSEKFSRLEFLKISSKPKLTIEIVEKTKTEEDRNRKIKSEKSIFPLLLKKKTCLGIINLIWKYKLFNIK